MATFTYTKPTVGGSEDTWGDTLNANWDAVAAFIGSLDSAELAQLDGNTFTGGLTVQSGNVGIGTSSPSTELEVVDASGSSIVQNRGAVDTVYRAVQTGNTGFGYYVFGDSDDAFVGGFVYGHDDDSLRVNVNNAERMRIDSAGNVGIGTTTPSEKLEVNGTVKATNFEGGFPELTQAQAEDDTSTVFGQVSGQRLAQAVAANAPLTKEYLSSAFSYVSGGLVTLAHGLGKEPNLVQYIIEAKVSTNAYAIGDRILIDANASSASTNKYNYFRVDATNIYIRFNDSGSFNNIQNKSDGDAEGTTPSHWDIYVRAYA